MRTISIRGWLCAAFAAVLIAPIIHPAAPASAAPAGVTVVYTEGARWETGYSGQFTIDNASAAELADWTIRFTLPAGVRIGSLWNATLSSSGSTHTLTPPGWGARVPAGGTYTIGFNGVASGTGSATAPLTCTIDGSPCSGEGGGEDTQAPSAPTGVAIGATTSSSITLGWSRSDDNVGVAGYEILDGSTVVRTVIGDTPGGTVGGLDADTAYTFTVRAFDAAGNRSAASGAVSGRTAPTGGGGEPPAGDRRVGYFTQWGIYDRGYLVSDIDTSGTAAKLTHINYAFANINSNGQCFQVNQAGQGDAWADYGRSFTAEQSVDGVADTWDQDLRGNFNQLRELKAKYPHLKVNLSIGGWTWSRYLSDAVRTEASRQRMVESCIDMFLRGNLPVFDGAGGPGSAYGVFDGIDLDWEWPGSEGNPGNVIRPEDKQNYTALVQEFRTRLDALGTETGRTFELTSFMPADPRKIDAGFEVDRIMPNFDFVTLQGYDFHGGWESTTNHQSNLLLHASDPGPDRYSAEITVDAWTARGAPASKLVLGVPFYSRGWTGVPAGPGGDGLFQQGTGPAPGPYEAGIDDWKNISRLQGYTLHRDDRLGTAWLYNGSTFWTYDDPAAMTRKADWSQAEGLGGVMVWSLDGDDGQGTLMTALDQALRP
ncbi:glycosyl hydrolase family 18 protein [Nocardiopsis mangrovi]|uniref:chitinase n=1 Tax=Nocardiopsis mangrovi TaxID=1179818 RepID=A0ABV9E6J4_9ACTN